MKRNAYPLFLLACWLLTAAGLMAQTPVAYYAFSGNAKDQSSFANNASVNGATLTQDRFGWSNSAMAFDGLQGAITAPNAAQLNSANATISFWVKPNSFPPSGEVYILSFGGWQERWKVSLPDHGKPVFTTHSNGACCSNLDPGAPLTIGTWTHVVMVHDGAKDIIYVDGVKKTEANAPGALDTTTKPLGIGFDPIGNNYWFDGALDDVTLFDVALDATEIAALYAVQSVPPPVIQGKVASYSFSGNGADNTAFSNHADIISAAPTADRFGYGNSALLCDGASSEVSAPNAAQLNSPNATISVWVRPNSFPPSGEVYIMSFGGWQERWKVSLPDHGKPVFTTHSNGACCSNLDPGTPLTIGAWTHLVMVHDGAKDIIYVNGAKKAEANAPGALDTTTKPLGIGFDPIDNNYWFDGSLDEVEIYNYALSDAEIAALYTTESAFPGTPDDLVASYSLNGNGTDDTQFGNNANLDGAAKAVANRHGWGSNALSGQATAANSVALQSDYTTISFWINPNSFPVSGELYILSNGGWQERWKVSLPDHGKPVFTTHANGACCTNLDSGTPLTIGAWTHIAMVHDGAKDIIYVNGVQKAETNAPGTLDKTSYPLGIGYDPIDNGSPLDGSLDDIQVYNRALSAAEIAALYADQNQVPLVPGNLVADYKSDGNANDATAYSNHAAVQGAQLTTDRFGKSNQAYSFNGVDQSLVAANSPQLNSPFETISFWVKPNAFPVSGELYILSNGGWQERWKVSLPDHGKPVFTTHSDGVCCSNLDTGTPLTIGDWTHLAMVHDGAKDIIYVNGVKKTEANAAGALDVTTKPLGIGFDPIDNNYFFNGSLDEVQIYNVALSDAEIAALYATQSQPPANADDEAPDAPLNLTAKVVFTDVLLSWFPATDNVGVTAYNVYQYGVLIATTPSTASNVSGLPQLTDFIFGVTAVDAAGNESLMTTIQVTTGEDQTPDITPPSTPGNLNGTAASNSILLSWDASTDDRKVAGYVISIDGVVFDTVSTTTLSAFISGLDPLTLYTFEVYAFDPTGNNSVAAEITLSTSAPLDTGEPGLVAHYPFDGDAKDATPYHNDGVIGGNPVFEVANHPNGGGQNIKFDGTQDSVLVPNAVQLISDYATVSFWIRVDEAAPIGSEDYVIDFGHWDQRWKISLPGHRKIVWTTHGHNLQFSDITSDMDSGDGNELAIAVWSYVTMVHDGTNDIIYIDGVQVSSKPVMTKLNSTARPLCFGSNPIEIQNGPYYFIGALDNVKIYNKALIAAEVAKLFQSGTTSTDDQNGHPLSGVVLGISPNPVTDVLTVKHAFSGNEPLLVRVFDVQGRQVDQLRYDKNEVPAGQFFLQVGQYTKGTYMLNFVLGGKSLGSLQFNKQ